jgi:C1A family cysteine protease
MRLSLVVLAVVVVAALFVAVEAKDAISEKDYQSFFTAFVKKYNKKYTHDEFFPRYTIFKANYNKIRLHNMGKSTFSMAINEFADLTFAEFHAKYTGYKRIDNGVLRSKNGPHNSHKTAAPPASVDWRTQNAVTPIKNQQQCGSCWAFSTTGSVEGAHAIKTKNLVSLSEQQLVDCSGPQGNQGCNGGLMDQAFQYIISNNGITTEAAYPYTAQDGNCNTNVTAAATISSFVDVTAGSETALLAAVAIGPVSVAIEADQECFQFYSGGILSDPTCGMQLDHGVLAVGYGTDSSTNTPYWIVKNSWGTSWGESGYVQLVRGQNECGIAQEASYPVV